MLRTCIDLFGWRGQYSLSCLVVIAALSFLTACNQRPSPELRSRVESQLYSCAIDASNFPSGWRLTGRETYEVTSRGIPGNGLGGIEAIFYRKGFRGTLHAIHAVLAYSTPERAAIALEQSPRVFYDASRLTPWLEFDVAQIDLSADAVRVGCAYLESDDADISRKNCHFLAQYGRFLTTFQTPVVPEYIAEGEMVRILQSVNERMLQCVDAYADAVWEEESE